MSNETYDNTPQQPAAQQQAPAQQPVAAHAAQTQAAPEAPMPPAQPQASARRPDQIAYTVRNEPDGKSYWNRVGVSWSHKDGKGSEVRLESIPVDGCITLRDQRDKAMQSYDDARAEQPAQQQRGPVKDHGPQR